MILRLLVLCILSGCASNREWMLINMGTPPQLVKEIDSLHTPEMEAAIQRAKGEANARR